MALSCNLARDVERLEPNLRRVILAVADAVAQCATILREDEGNEAGTTESTENASGDTQCSADLRTDEAFFAALRNTGCVACACSEEKPEPVSLVSGPGDGPPAGSPTYCVAWDPLDGSSVVDASFAVGSIVAVFPGNTLLGRTANELAAAAYAVYGPRTVLVVATRHGQGRSETVAAVVQEYVLTNSGRWRLSRANVRLSPASMFYAPANVRCCADNEAYRALLVSWMMVSPPTAAPCDGAAQPKSMTMRYSGALVADVHHVLTKGGGVFVCPSSAAAPSKLRLVFEAAAIAFIVHAAGGTSLDSSGQTLLEVRIDSYQQRTALCVGSSLLVAQCKDAMKWARKS